MVPLTTAMGIGSLPADLIARPNFGGLHWLLPSHGYSGCHNQSRAKFDLEQDKGKNVWERHSEDDEPTPRSATMLASTGSANGIRLLEGSSLLRLDPYCGEAVM